MTRATRLGWLFAALLPCSTVSAAPSLVVVVDGAGGFEASSKTLYRVVREDWAPVDVRSFRWTHGYFRIAADQMHAAHLRHEAQLLANFVLACRQANPQQPVFLFGHSAGCGLVLGAAEHLPPGTLEGIVLLAPAVYTGHDLRPALASSCRGIDVFISHRDWPCLCLGTLLAGTTDRYFTVATAGRIGFQTILDGPDDALLYAKLRHHSWDPSMRWTGHDGGHYGSYQPGFLRYFVAPLLLPTNANAE
jgi:pimeloyl-ACP methyl ester carboxylesterase